MECVRFFILANPPELADLFQLASVPDIAPRYNVAPAQAVPVVRLDDAGRELVNLRWGLVAPWAKDAKIAPINARSETG